MKRKEIIVPGVGGSEHLITLDFEQHCVKFSISEIDGNYGVADGYTLFEQLKGVVKWDGCSDVTTDTWMHFCEPQHFINLNRALQRAYNESALYFNAKRENWQDELPLWEDK